MSKRNQLEPSGVGRRVVYALALLLGVAYGSRIIWIWLAPVVPMALSLLVVSALYVLIFRGRR